MAIALLTIFMIIVMLFSLPIGFAMVLSTLLYIISSDSLTVTVISQRMYTSVGSYELMAIPFFILAGNIMNATGITQSLVTFAGILVGHMRGALAQISIVVSMFFAGMSGSAAADATAVGSTLIPAMKKAGYQGAFAAAVVSSASTIGPIIPPSIHMVLFASLVSMSAAKLFIGGIFPGIIMGIYLMIVTYFIARKRNFPRQERPGREVVIRTSVKVLPALSLPVIIIVGMISGFFTATEAAAIAVLMAFILSIFIYRSLTFKILMDGLVDAVLSTGQIMLIIGMAASFAWIMTAEGLPHLVSGLLLSISRDPSVILLLITLGYFIGGCFMCPSPMLIMTVPIIYPLIRQLGIDPMVYGLVSIVSALIGQSTPPVGVCMYISCSIAKCDILSFTRESLPYYVAMIAVVVTIIYFPTLVTYLPSLMK